MIATLIEPYATVRGSISKRDKLYTRMLNGRCLIQHKPRRASPAQRAHRDWFGKTYGFNRKKSFSPQDGLSANEESGLPAAGGLSA